METIKVQFFPSKTYTCRFEILCKVKGCIGVLQLVNYAHQFMSCYDVLEVFIFEWGGGAVYNEAIF